MAWWPFGRGDGLQRPGRTLRRRLRQWFGDNDVKWTDQAQARATQLGQKADAAFAQRDAAVAQLGQAQKQGGGGQGGQGAA